MMKRIINKKTVIIGMLLVIVFSMGLGFLFSESGLNSKSSQNIKTKTIEGSTDSYKHEVIDFSYDGDNRIHTMTYTTNYDVYTYIDEMDISDEEKEQLKISNDRNKKVKEKAESQTFNTEGLKGVDVTYTFSDDNYEMIMTRTIDFEKADIQKLIERGILYVDAEIVDDIYPELDSMLSFYKNFGFE